MPRKGKVENLIPMNKRSKDEVREIGRRGGVASGKTRADKRDLKQVIRDLLEENCKDNVSWKIRIALALLTKAGNGEIKAIGLLQEILDDGKKQKIEMTSPDGSLTPKGINIDFSGMTPEELTEIARAAFTGK